jgi:isocitrate dehydrogenase
MSIITTTKGPMNSELLYKRVGTIDDEDKYIEWIEYYLPETEKKVTGNEVHRSVHAKLKKNVVAEGVAAMLGEN